MEVLGRVFCFAFCRKCTLVSAISNNFGLKGLGFKDQGGKSGLNKDKDRFCACKVPPYSCKLNEYDIIDFHSPNIPMTFEP